jgi:hypothetical protein
MRYRLTFISGVAVGYVLGARAGRERYEQLRKTAQQLAQNPAVQDAARNARDAGRTAAVKTADTVAGKVGDKVPRSVSERVRYLRERSAGTNNDWGTSNT